MAVHKVETTSTGGLTRGGWTPVGTASARRAIDDDRRTSKGQQTRWEILDAARRVFERSGYLAANVADIVAEAHVARGSFYTYFPSKRELFQVLFAESSAQIDRLVTGHGGLRTDPVAAIEAANRRFLEYYRDSAAFQRLVDQADTIDEGLRAARVARRAHHVDRIAHAIRRWQSSGHADPEIDAAATAAALISMTTDYCYWRYVGQESATDGTVALATLNRIWVQAIGLRSTPRPAARPDSTNHVSQKL